ncbi:hypothetical protein V3W47_04875 [Deinococcus sp. YIM 134068]|uniref:hypothetical protein n=1 Tax=Deinococcus lichenicola TaxID=3118910 RepID=UPI002F947163
MAATWRFNDHAEHVKMFFDCIVVPNYMEFYELGLEGRDRYGDLPKSGWNAAAAIYHMWEHLKDEWRIKYESQKPDAFKLLREVTNTYKHFKADRAEKIKELHTSRSFDVSITDVVHFSDGVPTNAKHNDGKIKVSIHLKIELIDGTKLDMQDLLDQMMRFYIDILNTELGEQGSLQDRIELFKAKRA